KCVELEVRYARNRVCRTTCRSTWYKPMDHRHGDPQRQARTHDHARSPAFLASGRHGVAWCPARSVLMERNSDELIDGSFDVANGIDFSDVPPAKRWVVDLVLPEGVSVVYGPPRFSKACVALEHVVYIVTG